jgi:hypothetical protein
METHLNDKNEHTSYNIGLLRNGEYKLKDGKTDDIEAMKSNTNIYYGYDCIDRFVDELKKMNKEASKEHLKKYPKAGYNKFTFEMTKKEFTRKIYGHNSARYDNFLILKKMFGISNIIEKNGIISLSAMDYIQFVDNYRHCPFSLHALCESFEVPKELCKTSFPHDFVNENKDINYVGSIPDSNYWPKYKIPDEFKEMEVFDFKKVSIEYQKLDCISLMMCFQSYTELMIEVTGLNPSNFLTAPSMSYNYVINNISKNNEIELIKDLKIDSFIRKSTVGGRCFVQKSKYEVENQKEFNEFNDLPTEDKARMYKSCVNYCVDVDQTSLYPASCYLFKYPVGASEVIEDVKLEQKMNELNAQNYKYLSVICCDITFTDKNIICPIISSKENGRNVYSLTDKKNIVLTSVDIEEAIKHNKAKITKIHSMIEWKKSAYIFRECIGNLFDQRVKAKKEKKEALSFVLKLLMNSSYGKFIQKIIDTSSKIVTEVDKFDDYLYEMNLKSWSPLNDEQMFMEFKKKLTKKDIKNPCHIGVFILAFSKRIMNNAIEKFNGFTDWNNTFFYTDTDSMIVTNKVYELLQKENVIYDGKEIPMVGENLGQLHDDLELKDSKIIKGIWIRPKLYLLEYIGYNKKTGELEKRFHIKSKGINSSIFDSMSDKEKVQQYENLLAGKTVDYELKQFKRCFKGKDDFVGVRTIDIKKTINKEQWSGRVYNAETFRWYPIK